MEILARGLAEIIKADPLPPMEQETIVVLSRAMAKWLSLELASVLGVWAGGRFLFPNALVRSIFDAVLPDLTRKPCFDREHASWLLMEIIGGSGNLQKFATISQYLAGSRHGQGDMPGPKRPGEGEEDSSPLYQLRLFKLSRILANLFDQYLVYRPELIEKWKSSKNTGEWQAELWRRLKNRAGFTEKASMLKECLNRLAGESPFTALPKRINIFGVSSLPSFHLRLIEAVAGRTDVNLFFMNPSRHFWADIKGPYVDNRACQETPTIFTDTGNRLLASMGQLGRDFFSMLVDTDAEWEEIFAASRESSLLGALQNQILECREPHGDRHVPDGSVVIQSCHSPVRELEVLFDHILALFDEDPSLTPKDILVMAPDIEIYAPLIPAVFDQGKDDPRHIPYGIADRRLEDENRLLEHLLRLLDTLTGRFPASAVLDLLQCKALRDRFSLTEADIATIEKWIREAGIRWGVDEESKRRLGLPPLRENTWQAGLDRLLMSWPMQGWEAEFSGIFPFQRVEEDQWETAGRFLDLLDTLFKLRQGVEREHTLGEWSDLLGMAIDALYLPSPADDGVFQLVRSSLSRLSIIQKDTGFDGKVGLQVVTQWLGYQFADQPSSRGFLSGGITFCSMLPMRAIPFKVICLLGMNDADFPRPSANTSFDLMAKRPRAGDRSQRLDDRYLFLEAILSARKLLYISFIGQSVKDNSELPPSVLVTELLDYLEEMCTDRDASPAERRAFREKIMTRNRLQPFNPDYFTRGSRLRSYSIENFGGARALLGPDNVDFSFLKGMPLDPAPAPEADIPLETFLEFFLSPVGFFCKKVLGLRLLDPTPPVEDNEPFNLKGLDAFRLKEFISAHYHETRSPETLLNLSRACGLLPHGTPGYVQFMNIFNEFRKLQERKSSLLGKGPFPIGLNIEIDRYRIHGAIEVCPGGLIDARYAKLKETDIIRTWIRHVLLCLLLETDPALERVTRPEARIIGLDETCYHLERPDDPRRILEELLSMYIEGWAIPLPLFPRTSFQYADHLAKKGDSKSAIAKARKAWEGNPLYPHTAEAGIGYHELCYRATDPLDTRFEETACRFWNPVIRSMKRC